MTENYYIASNTTNQWVKVISEKFNDMPFIGRGDSIGKILGITSTIEIDKLNEASLICFGKSIGVESFYDACIKLGLSDELPTFNCIDIKLTKKFLAEYQLTIIIKALNEGWYPNWEDECEYKYCPYFSIKGGFSYWNTFNYNTHTFVPSALLIKSNELSVYCGQKFLELYKDYYK